MAENNSRFISDEDVNKMHYRQAAELIQVPAEDRLVVLMHAHFLMNVTGGNLSGNLWTARQAYNRLGADGLAAETREVNAKLMAAEWRG